MPPDVKEIIENLFSTLPPEEKIAVISHGVPLYLVTLKKRLFLSQSKVIQFEEQYGMSLAQLDQQGLPDDANYQLHEDYLMWHHWADSIEKLRKQINLLEKMAEYGFYAAEVTHVSY